MQLNKKLDACSFLIVAASAPADDSIEHMTLADMRHASCVEQRYQFKSQRVIALTAFCARIHCTFLIRSQKV
jgi:hypothetical protein